jgi:hypothetical protein
LKQFARAFHASPAHLRKRRYKPKDSVLFGRFERAGITPKSPFKLRNIVFIADVAKHPIRILMIPLLTRLIEDLVEYRFCGRVGMTEDETTRSYLCHCVETTFKERSTDGLLNG